MSTCIASLWYKNTYYGSNSILDIKKRHRNQHATVFTFVDGSQLIEYKKGGRAYRDQSGYIMARKISL